MNPVSTLASACALALAFGVGATAAAPQDTPPPKPTDPVAKDAPAMQLGNFSVSLAVKDIQASKAFYEALGFSKVGGELEQNWLVLQNGTTTIGLFQGMFERNLLTFNPGWDHEKNTLKDFQDVRELQAALKEKGVALTTEAEPDGTGPAHFTLVDPDGNPILFDQHVDAPKR